MFPAYTDKSSQEEQVNEEKPSWLSNSSFIRINPVEQLSDSTSSEVSSEDDSDNCRSSHSASSKLKRSISPEGRQKKKLKQKQLEPGPSDDLLKGLENLCFLDVTPNPNIGLITHKKKKNKRKKGKIESRGRYFSKFKPVEVENEFKILDEEELMKKTEEFNVALREDGSNVELWLEYVHFQVCAVARRIGAEDGQNIAAWQWQINCILFSVGRLTAPLAIETFGHALEAMFRAFPSTSEPLVDILLQLCLFLRQAGLWEQLWLVIELSLELNLSTPNSKVFKVNTLIPEAQIERLEEDIITCGLPLGALWLRTEHLRDCVHFLPVEDSENDPQRIVHPSDVSHLIHPVRCVPRLIAVFLFALKVPMIPGSHCGISYLGLDKIPWATESPEPFLATLIHPYLKTLGEKTCLTALKEMTTGPQYISLQRPGAREFFLSISSIFESIIKLSTSSMTEDVLTPVAVWYIRWLVFVGDKASSAKAKKLLKEHRDCIPIYTEYAVLMHSFGDTSTCMKVMDTAVSMCKSPLYAGRKVERHYIAYMYRTYIELLYEQNSQGNRDKILNLLAKMVGSTSDLHGDSLLEHVITKFEHIIIELVNETIEEIESGRELSFAEVILGAPLSMWLACQAVLLRLKGTPWHAANTLKAALQKVSPRVNHTQLSLGTCLIEGLHEILVHIMHTACPAPDNYPALKEALRNAVEVCPSNLYFLCVAASVDVILGKLWTVSPVFFGDSINKKIFSILVHRIKMLDHSNASGDERGAAAARIATVAKSAISGNQSERNPLLWRLLLECAQALTPAEARSAFLRAADSCPWVKSIYYDAAKILPEEMGHIQDLLIEKELRVHITLEELEILRQGNI